MSQAVDMNEVEWFRRLLKLNLKELGYSDEKAQQEADSFSYERIACFIQDGLDANSVAFNLTR